MYMYGTINCMNKLLSQLQKQKKSMTIVTIKENLQPQYFSSYHFLKKNKIRDYFY